MLTACCVALHCLAVVWLVLAAYCVVQFHFADWLALVVRMPLILSEHGLTSACSTFGGSAATSLPQVKCRLLKSIGVGCVWALVSCSSGFSALCAVIIPSPAW
jgi:hypothetical protein